MAPSWWKHPQNKLKKCQEFLTPACNTVAHDGCCSATPCKICLEWETSAYDIAYGSAEFGTASWTGTVGGIAFTAYWERGYESGECEFVVIFNGEEVYRSDCYGGASCRNPAGEVEATVDYESGTLRWSVYEPRELQLIDDPDTGCKTHFCGSCHCSCECLCVTIDAYTATGGTGELCDVAYPCDAPLWFGTIGDFELSLQLGRDSYGECIITPTVNGIELDPVSAPGCGSMTATITTPEGDVITVTCKECACGDGACVGCCFCITEPATNADYVIDAPNCAALDGATGNVSGPDAGTATNCGSCVSLINSSTDHAVPTFVYDDSIPENGCVPQPGAEFQFKFALRCDENAPDSETDPGTTDACCRNVRLLVLDTGTSTIQRIIAPLSCTCDPVTGLMAIFSIEEMLPDCTTFFSGGVCDGLPTCTQLGDGPGGTCSLTGATVTFTQNC